MKREWAPGFQSSGQLQRLLITTDSPSNRTSGHLASSSAKSSLTEECLIQVAEHCVCSDSQDAVTLHPMNLTVFHLPAGVLYRHVSFDLNALWVLLFNKNYKSQIYESSVLD